MTLHLLPSSHDMSDIHALQAAFESGELVHPSSGRRSIVDLANTLAYITDVPDAPSSPNSEALADLIGPCTHLVLVAADGLGTNMVQRVDGGFISSNVVDTLSTVFPSSTPVVFTSLATGLWPNRHGVTGWHTHYREIDCVGTTIRFVRRSDKKPLGELGLSPTDAFPVPSLLQGSTRDSLSIRFPKDIVDSAFSVYTSGGKSRAGCKGFSQAVDMVVQRLANARGPTYTFVYTPVIDGLAHEHGVGHEKVLEATRALDSNVERLAAALPGDARLVLTADHGLLDSEKAYTISPSDPLVGLLDREPSGDSRAVQFNVIRGRAPEFEEVFSRRFGDCFYLISVNDAERLRLYGPGALSPLERGRMGSHLAISKGAATLRYLYESSKDDPQLASHSGLTADEMLVPLMVS